LDHPGEWNAPTIWLRPEGPRVDLHLRRLADFWPNDRRVLWRLVEHPVSTVGEPADETESLYRNLVELASDGICIVQDEMLRFVNPQLCALMDRQPGELLDMPFWSHIETDDAPALAALYERHLAGGRNLGVVPARLRHRDGSSIRVEIDAAIIPFRGRLATLVTLHDVTARVKADAALRESEHRLRLLMENARDTIWSYDLESQRFTFASPAIERHLGYTVAEGETLRVADLFSPDTARRVARAFREMIAAWPDRRSLTIEAEHRHKDGHTVWMEINGALVPRADGPPQLITGVSRDITERRLAEQTIRESEARYRRLVELSPTLIFLHRDGVIEFANEAAWRAYGGRSAADIVGRRVLDFAHPDQVPMVQQRLRQVGSGQPTPLAEVCYRALDGRTGYFEVMSVPITVQGRPTVLSVAHDTTERKAAESQLAYRMALLQLITRVATQFLFVEADRLDNAIRQVLAETGQFAGAHRAYVILFDAAGTTGSTTHEWCAPGVAPLRDDMQQVPTAAFSWWVNQLRRQQMLVVNDREQLPPEAEAEKQIMRRQGIRSVIAIPLSLQSGVGGFLGLHEVEAARDWDVETVTLMQNVGAVFGQAFDRVRAEQELRNSEETGRALLDGTRAVALLTDVDGRILAANRAATQALQRSEDELREMGLFHFIPPDRQDDARQVIDRVLATGQGAHEEREYRGRWYLMTVNPIRDDKGRIGRFACFARDITSARRREDALRDALQRAKEAELLKSRFLANMSHEIRTPLNHVIGMASVLLSQPNLTATERCGYLQIIKQGGESMLGLLTAILDLSKIEAGRLEPSPQRVTLREWLADLAKRYSVHAAARGLTFSLAVDRAVPNCVVCDTVMIEQVLNNLVDNAVKFTHRGGIELRVQPAGAPHEAPVLDFAVIDTGIGIEADKLDRIFDSFYQIDNSSTREYQGAGLGLTISRELARLLGGDLRVLSNPGAGSTFVFSCPVCRPLD
jgi:PAS domain S-box-containing protein